MKAVLADMDAAGAVSAKISFDVESVPMLGLVVTIGADASTAVLNAVQKLENEGFEEVPRIIPASEVNRMKKGFRAN